MKIKKKFRPVQHYFSVKCLAKNSNATTKTDYFFERFINDYV